MGSSVWRKGSGVAEQPASGPKLSAMAFQDLLLSLAFCEYSSHRGYISPAS